MAPVTQGQFTPLPEALCWAILELTSQRQAATLDTVRSALKNAFPAMQRPNRELVYDALAKLIQERKIYHTSQGYFVVTPETKRLRRDSTMGSKRNSREISNCRGQGGMLMSNDEAMALFHGEMMTLRDGNVTHQAVQTNLADVICGGNPNDKVLFARCRSVPGRLERRHSLRIWGSARRLHRSGSSRSLPRRPDRSETSSSAEYTSTDSPTSLSGIFSEKIGLLSRLFRRTTRRKGVNGTGGGSPLMGTFSAQYPPTEWFNPRVVHLHSVATQTKAATSPSITEGLDQSQASFRVWDDSYSVRSATLPRRHQHQPTGDSTSLLANSTPRSSRRHRSPCSSTLPRSKCSSLSRCTSRASVLQSTTAATSAAASSTAKTTTTTTPPLSLSLPSPPPSPLPPPPPPPLPQLSSSSSLYSTNKSAGSLNSVKTTNSNTLKSSGSMSSTNATIRLGKSSSSRQSSRRPSQDSTVGSGGSSISSMTKLSSKLNSPQHRAQHKSNLNERKLSHSSSSSVNQKTTSIITNSSSSSSSSSTTTTSSSTGSHPWKMIQTGTLTPLQETQNSITLQVSTNLSPGINPMTTTPQEQGAISNSVTLASNTTSTTTISSSPGTKIYVHQNNSSPIHSVITFENSTTTTPVQQKTHVYDKKIESCTDIVIDKEKEELISEKIQLAMLEKEKILNTKLEDEKNKKFKQLMKLERPSTLFTTKENQINTETMINDVKLETDKDNKLKIDDDTLLNKLKSTNRLNNSQAHLIDTEREKNTISNDNNSSIIVSTNKNTNDAMNNSRKLSLSLSKDTLSYRNLLRPGSKNNIISNPPSPTKSFDGFGGSFNNVYIENLECINKSQSRAPQGSEPSLDKTISRRDLHSYPSLSDMQVQFTSLAAQKILNGCPINSVDTLVEVNMAASEKPNNRDVTVHTDFGLV